MKPVQVLTLTISGIGVLAGLLAADAVVARDAIPAKALFGKATTPAHLTPDSIGFYSRGCLAGAQALPADGPAWQAMRRSRSRYWGTPELVSYIEKLARDARQRDGWPGLLIGDMSQPRGGPMRTGHASHQTGLDVDIWFTPMPQRTLTARERERMSATSVIKTGTHVQLRASSLSEGHFRLLRRAASYAEVDRIFVNPGIKKELCERAGVDRTWLRKIRPWYKHDDHFHVRLSCPATMMNCVAQDATPQGDGCGEELVWWLGSEPYKPPEKPVKPVPALTLADLPATCVDVLQAVSPATAAQASMRSLISPSVLEPVLRHDSTGPLP